MLLTTFDEKEYLDYVREESREEGRLEERKEGLRAMIATLKLANIPLDKAYSLIIQSPQYAEVSKEEVAKHYNTKDVDCQ